MNGAWKKFYVNLECEFKYRYSSIANENLTVVVIFPSGKKELWAWYPYCNKWLQLALSHMMLWDAVDCKEIDETTAERFITLGLL